MSRNTGLGFHICYVCGVRITKRNTAGITPEGKTQPCCKPCHAEVSFCKLWRKKSAKEIRSYLAQLERRIAVITKVLQRKLTGSPKVGTWRAKKGGT
jgi:hypothetical protein